MLSTSFSEIYGRCLSHLAPHLEESQLDVYKEKTKLFKGNPNWNEIKSLFIQLAHDMETHRLG
jgi:hypothetical protein